MSDRKSKRRVHARPAEVLGSAFLILGLLSAATIPAASRAIASTVVAQSFGAQNATASATLSASPPMATTTGDLLVATIRDRNTTVLAPVSNVTDAAGNVWSRAATVTYGQAVEDVWYVANALSLSTSQAVTVTVGGTSAATTAIAFTVLDVSGAAQSSPLDVTAIDSGKTQPSSTGTTLATTQASEIAIGDIGWNTNVSPSGQTAGYTATGVEQSTVSGSAAGEQAAWQLLSATGTQTYGATLSSSTATWTGAIVTFKVGTSTPPKITGFSPSSGGPPGTVVTITGSALTGASAVTFNGIAATFQVNSDTGITATVPCGATTGAIAVTTSGGTATSSSFAVSTAPGPTITSLSPTKGPVGTPVTISGAGLYCETAVTFNGTAASSVTVNSDTGITATVPSGATTGPIKVTTPTGTSSSSFTVTATVSPHVMLIVEENQEYGSIIGSSKAPYINGLATTYASATSWYGVQHNSPNDYLELLSGSNQGFPTSSTPYTAPTLVDELHSSATVVPWQAYMENMPNTPCWKGTPPADGLYIPGHNPFHFFNKYTTSSGGWCSSANLSTEGVVTYPGASGLLTALTATNAPDFVQISPNNCDNMHGDTNSTSPCKGDTTGQLISAGDAWLLSNIDPIIKSSWFTNFNSIVIITWDEGTTNNSCCSGIATGGQIATVVVTSNNKGSFPSGFGGTGDHYGTLRSIEDAYGVPLLLNSQNLTNGDLSGAFGP